VIWIASVLWFALGFLVIYFGVRAGVSDALSRTLRADLIRDLELLPHELDRGDDHE
jgi:hypothetical protein